MPYLTTIQSSLAQWSALQWTAMVGAALFIGIAKTGIRGSTMLAIPIFAQALGARVSAGVVLFLLVLGDAVATRYYLRNAQWKTVLHLLPWTLAGVVLGAILGDIITESTFRRVMGTVLVISSLMLLANELRRKPLSVTPLPGITESVGVLGGFSSMIGNAAAPLTNLYFLARGYSKQEFVGTAAVLFLVINLVKVPVHVFYWKTIELTVLPLVVVLIVPVLVGSRLGFIVTRVVPERPFRLTIAALAAIASLRLVL